MVGTTPNAADLIQAIVGLMGACTLAAAGIAKISASVQKGRADNFQRTVDAQREEIDRCNKRIEELDADVDRERKEKHDIRNQLQIATYKNIRYEAKYGPLPTEELR